MTLVKNDDGSYSLWDEEKGLEIMRGTYNEVVDWGFEQTKDED